MKLWLLNLELGLGSYGFGSERDRIVAFFRKFYLDKD